MVMGGGQLEKEEKTYAYSYYQFRIEKQESAISPLSKI
jgi:hypothetical protein